MMITHPWLTETDNLALPTVVYGMLMIYGFGSEASFVEQVISTRPLTHSDTKAVRRCLELLEASGLVVRDGVGYRVSGYVAPVAHRTLRPVEPGHGEGDPVGR